MDGCVSCSGGGGVVLDQCVIDIRLRPSTLMFSPSFRSHVVFLLEVGSPPRNRLRVQKIVEEQIAFLFLRRDRHKLEKKKLFSESAICSRKLLNA